jgi:hypothetical protein
MRGTPAVDVDLVAALAGLKESSSSRPSILRNMEGGGLDAVAVGLEDDDQAASRRGLAPPLWMLLLPDLGEAVGSLGLLPLVVDRVRLRREKRLMIGREEANDACETEKAAVSKGDITTLDREARERSEGPTEQAREAMGAAVVRNEMRDYLRRRQARRQDETRERELPVRLWVERFLGGLR